MANDYRVTLDLDYGE